MKKIELLAPAGNFESLVAAVQNGADAVYFGGDKFNARINSENFQNEELAKAIQYAKLRNVKTHLTLNILIKDKEFKEAMNLVDFAYLNGIDAIIVQDLGLAKAIIKKYPNLEVHASTQTTTYNKETIEQLEKIGFKRAVLSRELNIEEIKNIVQNTNLEIEIFIHGALCICYSGQCLMSSLIGGRSGNRGKCAGTCRLPFELLEENQTVQKGYLLSSKDVCTLDFLPEIIKTGISSLKIEGRMKSPEYVSVVTSIYRKYLDLAQSEKPYVVEAQDKEKLMQIFNRGGFSTGYLKGKLGRDMMFIKKTNHIGIEIGKVISYNKQKGHIKLKLDKELNLGDSICIKDSSCKISELMKNNQNIKNAAKGEFVTIGRLKGPIKSGDTIYKTVSIKMKNEILQKNTKENVKRNIEVTVNAIEKEPLEIIFKDVKTNIKIIKKGEIIKKAEKLGTDKERICEQLQKTGNTIFNIEKIETNINEKIFIPIKEINELRRIALEELEKEIIKTFKRNKVVATQEEKTVSKNLKTNMQVGLLLNNIKKQDYSKIQGADRIYLPINLLFNPNIKEEIDQIFKNYKTYIFLTSVIKGKYYELVKNKMEEYKNKAEGIVVSNLSQINMIQDKKMFANYTLNIANNNTIKLLEQLNFEQITISPEMDKETISALDSNIPKELIVYGRTLLMTSEYCPIGTGIKCPGICKNKEFYLKDRMGFKFPIITNPINCNSMIYNSKITSISYKDLNINNIRIDILEESIEEINNIIKVHKLGNRMEGQNYTNGNLNREI